MPSEVELRLLVTAAVRAFDVWLAGFPRQNAQGCLKKMFKEECSKNASLWDNSARRLVADLVLGAVVMKRRIEHTLCTIEGGSPNPNFGASRARCLLAIWAVSRGSFQEYVKSSADLAAVFDVPFSFLQTIENLEQGLEGPEMLGVELSFPQWFVDALALRHELATVRCILEVSNMQGPTTLRVNSLLATRDQVRESLQCEGIDSVYTQVATGLRLLPTRDRVTPLAGHGAWNLDTWKKGYFEVQDEGSQVIVEAAEIRPGQVVLDYCAGNGGKSLAMAAMVGAAGRVYCWDTDKSRLRHLMANARRAGAENIIRIVQSLEAVEQIQADVVLCDAVCSSSGTLRRHPCNRWRLDEHVARVELPQEQRSILTSAQRCVKLGGRLVYATCSLLQDENEDVAAWFGTNFADFSPLSFDCCAHTCNLLPQQFGHDGFFMARWTRVQLGQ